MPNGAANALLASTKRKDQPDVLRFLRHIRVLILVLIHDPSSRLVNKKIAEILLIPIA